MTESKMPAIVPSAITTRTLIVVLRQLHRDVRPVTHALVEVPGFDQLSRDQQSQVMARVLRNVKEPFINLFPEFAQGAPRECRARWYTEAIKITVAAPPSEHELNEYNEDEDSFQD